MRLFDVLGMFLGSLTLWPRTFGAARMPQGIPPTDYTVLTQPELLQSFSDAIGPNGITPRSMRNFVASTVTTTPGGLPPTVPLPLPGWTTAGRPDGTALAGPAIGYNYTLKQIDMWDDQLQQWVNPSFQGGTVTGDTNFAGNVTVSGLAVSGNATLNGQIVAPHLVTSCSGQPSGTFRNNNQTVAICP